MSFHIDFRKKRIKLLRINIFPWAKIHEIFSAFEGIRFSQRSIPRDHAMYAVLELINNSLRAHRETNVMLPIQVRFQALGSGLQVEIRDAGGGFDPSRLPYDINGSLDGLDINDRCFQEYRNVHNNTRFGMGLYIAKRTFSEFRLSFVNERGDSLPWGSRDIVGTHIRLAYNITGDAK